VAQELITLPEHMSSPPGFSGFPFTRSLVLSQWPTEKVQKDKQRSTKHTNKTKDRVKGNPLKPGGELMCSGRVIRKTTKMSKCIVYGKKKS
jgi:hypothetical protein